MIIYLSPKQVLFIHERQIEAFGGHPGLKCTSLLESACIRPAMTFGGEDLYPDLPAKAAALMHSLVMNHPFVDGNKRTGAAAAIVFLGVNKARLTASSGAVEKVTFALAAGQIGIQELTIWFRQNMGKDA